MFTGIIEATGKIVELTQKQGDLAIRIQSPNLDMKDVKKKDRQNQEKEKSIIEKRK